MDSRLTSSVTALAAAAFLAGTSSAGLIIDDTSKIEDQALRERIGRAAERLKERGSDLDALEALLGFFGEAVVDTVGINVSYSFSDETKRAAYEAVLDWYSIDFLGKALTQGSDLARSWALRKLRHQAANSSPDPSDSRRRLGERGGVVDEAAKAEIRDAVMLVVREASPRTRGLALSVTMRVMLVEDRETFLKGHLDDAGVAVVAAAISALADTRGRGAGIEATVWSRLGTARDEDLIVACLRYLWLADRRGLDERKRRILEGLVDDPRVGERRAGFTGWRRRNPRRRVLTALAAALSQRARPEDPAMVALLLRLAEHRDDEVRYSAIRSLRNARTPEVGTRLVRFFREDEPQRVRGAALEVLGVFRRRDIVLAAARDEDEYIRSSSLYWLRHLGARGALEAALEDPSKHVRAGAARELKWMEGR
ncbi:MAG: HEAT repeat domain-containing protein [Planctomycetota bacterium]|jgi:hypothetical protein